MTASARRAMRLAPIALALAAVRCAAPVPFLPPGPLTWRLDQEALHDAPPDDIRVESLRFSVALADYGSAVQRLMLGETPLDEPQSGLFRRLADAIAAAPRGALVGAPAAAQSIRLDAIVLADPRATGKPRVAARALMTAATALLGLARGPYRASPDVLARAREVVATATVVSSGEPTPELIARGLRGAELTLTAIAAAVPQDHAGEATTTSNEASDPRTGDRPRPADGVETPAQPAGRRAPAPAA